MALKPEASPALSAMHQADIERGIDPRAFEAAPSPQPAPPPPSIFEIMQRDPPPDFRAERAEPLTPPEPEPEPEPPARPPAPRPAPSRGWRRRTAWPS